MSKKQEAQEPQPKSAADELSSDELDQVSGGIGLLLPAVQKVRDAATRTREPVPMEEVSFNFTKITHD